MTLTEPALPRLSAAWGVAHPVRRTDVRTGSVGYLSQTEAMDTLRHYGYRAGPRELRAGVRTVMAEYRLVGRGGKVL